MPDFSAISAAMTAVKNLLDGFLGLTGSLTGTETLTAFDALMGSLGGDETAAA